MGRFGSVAEKIRFKVNFEQGERRVPGWRRGLSIRVIWAVEFLREGYKIRWVLPMNQHSIYQKEIIIFYELV